MSIKPKLVSHQLVSEEKKAIERRKSFISKPQDQIHQEYVKRSVTLYSKDPRSNDVRRTRKLTSICSQSHVSSNEEKSQNKDMDNMFRNDPKSRFKKCNEYSNNSCNSEEDSDACNSLFDNVLKTNVEEIQERQSNPSFRYRMSTEKIVYNEETPKKEEFKLKELNLDLKHHNFPDRESIRIQNLCRMSLKFLEEKQRPPMLIQRNFPKQIESLQLPKLKYKQSEPRKKKSEDRYSVYKISQERNKLKKLKCVKSASPIRNSCNYYDIIRQRQVTKYEKYTHLHNK